MFCGAIDNDIGTDVVKLEGRGWLGMGHLSEDVTDNGPLFVIKKGSTNFGFGGIVYNHHHDGAEDMNVAFRGIQNWFGLGKFAWIWGDRTEVKLSSCAALVFVFR